MSGQSFAANSNSLRWYAAHEARLIWRDFASLVTAGKPRRIALVGTIITAFMIGMHMFVVHLLKGPLATGIAADKATLLMISGGMVKSGSISVSGLMKPPL